MESHETESSKKKESTMLLQKAEVQSNQQTNGPNLFQSKQSKDGCLLHLPQELSRKPKVDQLHGLFTNFDPGLLLICVLDQSTLY